MLSKMLLYQVYIFYCSLLLTIYLHLLRGRWWPILCHPYVALRNVQKGCIPGSVRIILTALTNSQGSPYHMRYAQLLKVPVVHLRSSSEVLTQQYSATHSAALPPIIGGSFMYLSVILLVNKCHFCLGRKGENNVCCKTFLYSTREITLL